MITASLTIDAVRASPHPTALAKLDENALRRLAETIAIAMVRDEVAMNRAPTELK